MYAQLTYAPQQPLPWIAQFFAITDVTTHLDQGAAGYRKKLIQVILATDYPGLDAAERTRIDGEAAALLCSLPAEGKKPGMREALQFEAYLALAHFSEPPAFRAQREQAIQSIVDRYLGWQGDQVFYPRAPQAGRESLLTQLRQHIGALARHAVLVPDALQDIMLQTVVLEAGCQNVWMNEAHAFPSLFEVIAPLQRQLGWGIKTPTGQVLYETALSLEHAQSADYLRTLRALTPAVIKRIVEESMTQLTARLATHLPATRCAVVWRSLQAVNALGAGAVAQADDLEDVVRKAVDDELSLVQQRLKAVASASFAALARGVRMDATTLKANRQSEQRWQNDIARAERDGPPRTQASPHAPAGASGAPTPTALASPPSDPVHARSVEWLVRWISQDDAPDGARRPLDRPRIAAAVNATRRARRTAPAARAEPQANPPQEADSAADDWTDADVEEVIDEGLRDTVRFVRDELRDTLQRAQLLGAAPAALADCQAHLERLSPSIEQPRLDEVSARHDVAAAEDALRALRADLRAIVVAQQFRQRFDRALREALRSEALICGKRVGGVIKCRVPDEAWAWVKDTYGATFLPVDRLDFGDGLPAPLGDDRALALYVTGSSTSGYSFNVSVHLWIRRAGRPGNASAQAVWGSPMNHTDWVDTRVPCAVLHVERMH